MSRGEKGVLLGTGLLVVLVIVLEMIAPRPFDWSETYYAHSRDPFGCKLVRERLPDLFPQGVTTVHQPIYNTADDRAGSVANAAPVVHFFVDRSFQVDDLDVKRLLEMVANGDDAFIAAEDFCYRLEDTLGIRVRDHWPKMDSAMVHGAAALFNDTSALHFTCWPLAQQGRSVFAHSTIKGMFERFPVDSAQVLAVNTYNDPVLLRMPWGRGHLFLCTAPQAFTNYYLLKPGSNGFMQGALSLLPDRPVLWDEYYKVGRSESTSPMRFVLGKPGLKAAYWTTLAVLALYLFVYAKRRQRAIPIVPPLKNTSRAFAETIGRLYYFKGDHADLARKMVLYFKDELRQRLYLRRSVWDDETIRHVSERTGIPYEEWRSAFRLMEHYEKEPVVQQEQLLKLNRTLSSLRSRL